MPSFPENLFDWDCTSRIAVQILITLWAAVWGLGCWNEWISDVLAAGISPPAALWDHRAPIGLSLLLWIIPAIIAWRWEKIGGWLMLLHGIVFCAFLIFIDIPAIFYKSEIGIPPIFFLPLCMPQLVIASILLWRTYYLKFVRTETIG